MCVMLGLEMLSISRCLNH